MNYEKINNFMDIISGTATKVVAIIAGAFACYYVPPLYVLILSAVLIYSMNKIEMNNVIINNFLQTTTVISLSALVVLIYCLIGGELNVLSSTSLGNFRFNLTNIPVSYIFTGFR